jgi:hypothetical protein
MAAGSNGAARFFGELQKHAPLQSLAVYDHAQGGPGDAPKFSEMRSIS